MQKIVLSFAILALTTEAARLKLRQDVTGGSAATESNYYSDYLSGYGYVSSYYDPSSNYSSSWAMLDDGSMYGHSNSDWGWWSNGYDAPRGTDYMISGDNDGNYMYESNGQYYDSSKPATNMDYSYSGSYYDYSYSGSYDYSYSGSYATTTLA